VVVVGDVDSNEVFKLVRDTYGRIPAKKIAERKAQIEPEQKGIRSFVLKAPAENAVIYMGWKVPELSPSDLSQRDPYALEVLAGVLDGNANARLNRILVRNKRLALSVGAGYDSCCSRTNSLFMINATLMPNKTPIQIETEIKKIISDIAVNGISEQELERVKIAITASQVYKRDSVFGQAMEIGSAEMGGLSWKQMDQWHQQLQNVKVSDVQEVAKKYFVDDHLTVGVLDPQPLDKNIQAANARAASQLKH
jgi:zinc protease